MVHPNIRRIFETLVATAFVDGILSDDEKTFLRRKAGEMRISTEMFQAILKRGEAGQLSYSLPPNLDQRLTMLDDMIDVVCTDGILERQENRLLLRFATHVNIDPHALGKRVRARMNQIGKKPKKDEEVVVIRDETPEKPPPPPPPPRPKREAPKPRPEVRKPELSANPQMEMPDLYRDKDFKTDALGTTGRGGDATTGQLNDATSGLPSRPPGPITLGHSDFDDDEIPPIAKGLLKSTLLFDGVQAGVEYVMRNCGVEDEARARELVDNLLRNNPDIKPNSIKV